MPFQDPNYPLPLIECVQSCWAQEPTQRPTAENIEKSFKESNFITLKNSYKIEDTKVTAVLVTKVSTAKEIIWVAGTSTSNGAINLMSYTFLPQDRFMITKLRNKYVHPRLCKMVSDDCW